MDHKMQLEQNLTGAQLEELARESLQKEWDLDDYMANRRQRMEMTRNQLLELEERKKPQPVPKEEMMEDMPLQSADEKEWKRKRREKKHLQQQEKEVNEFRQKAADKRQSREKLQNQKGKPDEEALQMFAKQIDVTKLSPRYVYEHFSEVRSMLDSWSEHLSMFRENGWLDWVLTYEQRVRIQYMKDIYEQSEKAFQSALLALGYRYQKTDDQKSSFLTDVTEEEKKQALEENMKLRREIHQGEKVMEEKVADELVRIEMAEYANIDKGFRETCESAPEYAGISSELFNHEYHYEAIREVRDMMKEYPEQYAAHKEEIDRIYKDYYQLMEVIAYQNGLAHACDRLRSSKMKLSSPKTDGILARRVDRYGVSMEYLRDRAVVFKSGIAHLLKGKRLSERAALGLRDYMKPLDQQEQERTHVAKQATTYANLYREKEEIFHHMAEEMFGSRAREIQKEDASRYMMLMEPGQEEHNEKVLEALLAKMVVRQIASLEKETTVGTPESAEAAAQTLAARQEAAGSVKALILPYLEEMATLDTMNLEHCTDEELLARNEELQRLSLFSLQVLDEAKESDPDDPSGRSIKENFLEERHLSKELFALRCNVIHAYAGKARMLSMMKAYEKGVLTEDCFYEEEQKKIRIKYGLQPEQKLSTNHMLAYVREKLAAANTTYYVANLKTYQSLFLEMNEMLRGKESHLPEAHPQFLQNLEQVDQEIQETAHTEKQNVGVIRKQYYKQHKQEARTMQLILETADGLEKPIVQRELSKLTREMNLAQIKEALSKRDYLKMDDIETPLKEALFRTYEGIEDLPAFREMTEEEFYTMCAKLSAGAFERDVVTPEEYNRYYEENMEGLQIYKERMRQHYEMLEERFHHKIPSLEYLLENARELKQLFGNVQVDTHMVEGMRDLIDLTDPDDLRLYHLCIVYNGFGTLRAALFSLGGMDNVKMREMENTLLGEIMQEKASFDYLDQAEQEEVQAKQGEVQAKQEETKVLREQDIDRFRQLAKAGRTIVEADLPVQMAFWQQVMDLDHFLEAYQEQNSFVLKQCRGWLEFAKKRVWFMAQYRYRTVTGVPGNPSVLEDAEAFTKAMQSDNPAEFLDAAFEMQKSDFLSQLKDISENEVYYLKIRKSWKAIEEAEQHAMEGLMTRSQGFLEGLAQAYFEKKTALADRLQEEIQRVKQQIPNEDGAMLAAYLVSQTQLGRDYFALDLMKVDLFDSAPMMEQVSVYELSHSKELERIADLNKQLEKALEKYGESFGKMGYLRATSQLQLQEFMNMFP